APILFCGKGRVLEPTLSLVRKAETWTLSVYARHSSLSPRKRHINLDVKLPQTEETDAQIEASLMSIRVRQKTPPTSPGSLPRMRLGGIASNIAKLPELRQGGMLPAFLESFELVELRLN